MLALAGDVCNTELIDQWVTATVKSFGSIDALCNVAGVLRGGPIDHQTAEDIQGLMSVNCLAQFLAIIQ